MMRKTCAPLAALIILLAPSLSWARGPFVSLELENLGDLEVISVSIKGPRKSCEASEKTAINATRHLDEKSVALAEAVALGKVFPAATIEIGGGVFLLENVLVTSYSVSGGGGNQIPTEAFSLSPEGISPRQPPECG